MMKIGPFLGINTRLPDFALKVRTRLVQGDYVRDAINVDIDNSGRAVTRQALSLVQAMTGAHSLFMTSATAGLVVRDSVLYAITLPDYSETLVKVLSSNERMSYDVRHDGVFLSNGTDALRWNDGAITPWAFPTPDAPTLSAIGGSLNPGWYQVAISYSGDGEGGVSACASIQLTATGGIRVALPGATQGATKVNVYVSGANGGVPLLKAAVDVGTSSIDVTTDASGREASVRNEDPLPAGRLAYCNGRLCSYAGNVLNIGSPYRHGYYLPVGGRIPFPAEVTNVVANQLGTYVIADKTYWIPGDIGDIKETIVDVLPFGGVKGTEFALVDRSVVGWFSVNGIVFGKMTGEVQPIMLDTVESPVANGSVSVVLDGEYRRVVSCGWCANTENNAVTRYDWSVTSCSGGYATTPDGICALSVGDVPWRIDFGKIDFGTDNIKHFPVAYVAAETAEPVTLSIGEYDYSGRWVDEEIKTQRIVPGLGLRAAWFDVALSSDYGARIAGIDFVPAASRRRV